MRDGRDGGYGGDRIARAGAPGQVDSDAAVPAQDAPVADDNADGDLAVGRGGERLAARAEDGPDGFGVAVAAEDGVERGPHTVVRPESVDLILTDPPYKPATLSCYRDLAEFAAHCLKPGGSLLVMAGTSHLPDVLGYLCNTDGLHYHWTFNYLMDGANLRFHSRAVRMGWKPVVWLVKGQADGTDRYDVVRAPPLAEQDNRYHDWGQNEGGFRMLLDLFAFPGQLVCDPFVGGGTTALAARALGCRFIGADVDEDCLVVTRTRVRQFQVSDPG